MTCREKLNIEEAVSPFQKSKHDAV
jgi:hypothetical protein